MSKKGGTPVYGVGGTATSSTNTYNSDPTVPTDDGDLTYHVRTTGTLTGTLVVQVSNTPQQDFDTGNARYFTYDLVTPPAISGAMEFLLKITRLKAGHVRLSYTNATNTGVIYAWVV